MPIIDKFFGIMDELLVVYDNYQTNRDAAMKLRDRLLDICRTLIPALERRIDYFNDVALLSKFAELTAKLEEMKVAFEGLTAASMTNVLKARDQRPAQQCKDIDRDITGIINSIFQLLGLQQALEVHSIYDQMKLASETDKGPYQFIHIVALRTFWKDFFRNDRSIKISDFVSFLMLTFRDQNRLDGINKDVLNETFVALDKDRDGSISIMEIMQSTRFINRDASLYKTMESLIRNKNILLIIPPIEATRFEKIVWGFTMQNRMRGALLRRDGKRINWKVVSGASNVGKTFRLQAAVEEQIRLTRGSVSILWIDFNYADSTEKFWLNVKNELSLAGNSMIEYQSEFRTLMKSISRSCIMVFDHVAATTIKASAGLIDIISEYNIPSSSITVIFVSVEELQLPDAVGVPDRFKIDPLNDEEASQLSQRYDITSNNIPAVIAASRGLPIEVIKQAQMRRMHSMQSLDDALFLFTLSDSDRTVAACLYPALSTGYVFDSAMAYRLCSPYITDEDAISKSLDRLVSTQWLRLKSDQGYFIPSTSHDPFRIQGWSTQVTQQQQCDSYYRYVVDQIVAIEGSLGEEDELVGCLLYDKLSEHVDYVLGCLSGSTTHVHMILEPSDVEDILLAMRSIWNIFSKRWIKSDTAVVLNERVFYVQKSKLGEVHSDVAASLNNIGLVLSNLGRKDEALSYYMQSLVIKRKVYGDEHSDVAASLNNIGTVLSGLGKYQESLSYHEQSLVIYKKVYGEKHTHVAASLNNVGTVLRDLGKNQESLSYHEQSLAIYKKVYGEEHSHVADSLNNVGTVLRDLGKNQESLIYYEQSLAIRKKVYGEEHSHVADSLNNIGAVLSNLIKEYDALKYYEQSSAIRRKGHREERTEVADSLNNICAVLRVLGKKHESLTYHEQSLAIRKKVYSDEHSDVAVSLNNIGEVLSSLGKKHEALFYFEQSLAIKRKVYGDQHPSIARTLNNVLDALGIGCG